MSLLFLSGTVWLTRDQVLATILCFISSVWRRLRYILGLELQLTRSIVINNGLGKHIWVAPPNAIMVFLQGLFISEICYTGVMTTVKYSILALYWRLFKATRMRTPILVITAMVTCWGFAVVILTPSLTARKFIKANCFLLDFGDGFSMYSLTRHLG